MPTSQGFMTLQERFKVIAALQQSFDRSAAQVPPEVADKFKLVKLMIDRLIQDQTDYAAWCAARPKRGPDKVFSEKRSAKQKEIQARPEVKAAKSKAMTAWNIARWAEAPPEDRAQPPMPPIPKHIISAPWLKQEEGDDEA